MINKLSELKKKDVINVVSGKQLGKICDLIIDDESGKILKLVVTGRKNCFQTGGPVEINYCCITKIGEDTILVKKGVGEIVEEEKEGLSFDGEE